MKIEGLVSRFTRRPNDTYRGVRLTGLGSQAIAVTEPSYVELNRANKIFGAVVGNGATFKAPVTAVPTTTATWAIWNGEPDGGKSYVILQAGFFLASGTAAVGASLIAAVSNIRHATQSAYASTVIHSMGGGGKTTKAVLANAVTIAGTQPPWVQLAADGSLTAAATIGQGLVARDLGGLYLVRPGGVFALDVLSGTGTTALYGVSVIWAELELDLED